jgi:glutamyl-tRNA reductase
VKIESLHLIGANFRTSSQDFRDEFENSVADIEGPVAVLATCNRVEVYSSCDAGLDSESLLGWLSHRLEMSPSELREQVYVLNGAEAALHLMRVAGGLDSLVMGEDQILGQVSAARNDPRLVAGNCWELAELFRRAVTTGRRIHAGHRLADDTSVAEAGIRWLARRREGGLQGTTVTLIGAGKMARSSAATVVDQGASRLILVNRDVTHAESIAAQLGRGFPIETLSLDDLTSALEISDVVVGTTRSPEPVLTVDTILDLATPRDIDPAVRLLPDITLIDLDGLSAALGSAVVRDDEAVHEAEQVARDGTAAYARWLRTREASSSIVSYRRDAKRLLGAETAQLDRHLASMSSEQRNAVTRAMRHLTNQLLHAPTLALRRAAEAGQLAEISGLLNVPIESTQESTERLN